MHLAICDDHMADRKQMERLLGRESDRRMNTTGVLYVDSFGSKESILVTPMIYDAIFMDIQMPVMNGYEATRKIRSLDHPDAKSVIILAMTANAFAEDVKESIEAGMNGHIAKPVDMTLLYNTISSLLPSKTVR